MCRALKMGRGTLSNPSSEERVLSARSWRRYGKADELEGKEHEGKAMNTGVPWRRVNEHSTEVGIHPQATSIIN